ncbi:MAG TPA: 30S ribosomal protein S6 [Desulfonatronum sp.]|nr:30S ribosomal protein S6 [Desulfonatronum sp.]
MRQYETLMLFSPEMLGERRQEILAMMTGIVEQAGGKILEEDDWGMRTLAYPVHKQTRGHYVRLEYAAPGQVVAEMERNLRITDGVFKFLSVKLADTIEESKEN